MVPECTHARFCGLRLIMKLGALESIGQDRIRDSFNLRVRVLFEDGLQVTRESRLVRIDLKCTRRRPACLCHTDMYPGLHGFRVATQWHSSYKARNKFE